MRNQLCFLIFVVVFFIRFFNIFRGVTKFIKQDVKRSGRWKKKKNPKKKKCGCQEKQRGEKRRGGRVRGKGGGRENKKREWTGFLRSADAKMTKSAKCAVGHVIDVGHQYPERLTRHPPPAAAAAAAAGKRSGGIVARGQKLQRLGSMSLFHQPRAGFLDQRLPDHPCS